MSRRLGIIIRVDQWSGLAHQTQEAVRWLQPDAVLAVRMGDLSRGPESLPLNLAAPSYARPITYGAATAVREIDGFLDACDVMLSVETFYDSYLVNMAGERGVERVLYANPELLDPNDPCERADRYLYAAEWGLPYPADGQILPWPTSPDLMANVPRGRNGTPVFVHAAADAMLDRNGTEVVIDAAHQIEQPCRIVIYGDRRGRQDYANERVSLEWRDRVADYRDLYAKADCLLLPRRYGALSLPMLEAAACGIPTITTDLPPQNGWFGGWPELLIPPGEPYRCPMKGNRDPGVPVATPSGADLAAAITKLAAHPDYLRAIGLEVRGWADVHSWEHLLPWWRDILDI